MRSCEVCNDLNVVSYVRGACPFDDDTVRTYCSPESRNATCVDECSQDENGTTVCRASGSVVCATTFDYTYKTFVNDCYACRDSSVVSYVNGECRDNMEPLRVSYCQNYIEECSNEEGSTESVSEEAEKVEESEMILGLLSPVCGVFYTGEKQVYKSYCAACRAGAVAFFTEGLCE